MDLGTRWWMGKNRTGLGLSTITLGFEEEKAHDDDENKERFLFHFSGELLNNGGPVGKSVLRRSSPN
jgi:hypothetical protein